MFNIDAKEFFKEIEKCELVSNLKELSTKETEIGFIAGKQHPVNPSTTEFSHMFSLGESKPIDVATLAAVLNYGSTNTTFNIPARPFFDNSCDEIERNFEENSAENVLDKDFYKNFSEESREIIYKNINEASYVPLSPITTELKGSDQPLIGESGTLIAATTYEIK